MNDWDFGRFFQKPGSLSLNKRKSDSATPTKNISDRSRNISQIKERKETVVSSANRRKRSSTSQSAAQALKNEARGFCIRTPNPNSSHKKEESYIRSVLPRVFRRENTDIFTPSSRHSSIFIEGNGSFAAGNDLSGKRRGSDASLLKYTNITLKKSDEATSAETQKEWKPARPRREKTEGDIITRRNRQELKENLEARRLEVEWRFSEETAKMKNRNSRILTSQNANSSTESEEPTNQVSLFLRRFKIIHGYILRFPFYRLLFEYALHFCECLCFFLPIYTCMLYTY